MRFSTHTRRPLLFVLTLLLLAAAFVAQAESTVAASGTFTGKSDHVTTGGVTILETGSGYVVVLEADFSLDGAPDPKIGFGNNGKFATKTLFTPLENKTGLQVYALPKSIDPAKYNEIYIWCEKFSVPLGVASLNR
ncbi:MAG: DM13 domain-containing protein [Acidobacteriota bacterium]